MDYDNQIVNEREDREERWFNACIWYVLLAVSGLSFLFVVYKHMEEISLKRNGNMYTTTYMDTSQTAFFLDKNNNEYAVRLSGWYPIHREKEIDLYYYGDDMANAKPLTTTEFWFFTEVGLGVFTSLFLWRAVKNSRRTKHYNHSI